LKIQARVGLSLFILYLALTCLLPLAAQDTTGPDTYTEETEQVSDHFDGIHYFNPGVPQNLPSAVGQGRRWIWNWFFRPHWPERLKPMVFLPGGPPVTRAPEGSLYITPVGHATFLIQMDGVNILTDPIWSERCSPLSWVGPKRYQEPGIPFEDLPPIDVVLVSHNHYDHLDLPTLERLAEKGVPHAVVPLGNFDLLRSTGIPTVDELDWWQSIRLSSRITVTLVPAQHFSSRSLRDRNETLWGGFVISGPSGNVYYSGDTGYGLHFREVARRFSPIRVALLPIAPFRSAQARESTGGSRSIVHMGPAEAVQAHIDLGTPFSIAAHFQVFRLGFEGFNDAPDALVSAAKECGLGPDAFVIPIFGQVIRIPPALEKRVPPVWEVQPIEWRLFDSCQPATWMCTINNSIDRHTDSPISFFTGISPSASPDVSLQQ